MLTEEQMDLIKDQVKDGKTYEEVGKGFNISRQRVHQIVTGYVSPSSRSMLSGGLGYIREDVRIRDNYNCQLCFKQWIPGERRFDVHHLDERMESIKNYEYDKNNSDKMITLCHRCHLRLSYIIKRTFDIMGITIDQLPKTPDNSPS